MRIALLAFALNLSAAEPLRLELSWGHTAPGHQPFYLAFGANQLALDKLRLAGAEPSDTLEAGIVQTRAGGGDIDRIELTLSCAARTVTPIQNAHEIWRRLWEHSTPDQTRRLQDDPAYRPDPRLLTLWLNPERTRGCSITVDQLESQRGFWLPELDLFVAVGEPFQSFSEHQERRQSAGRRRVLDEVALDPEATYAQFTQRWEDMGHPSYQNPKSIPPGHIAGLTWDSALFKFGIDRGAGVQNDYGKLDLFRFTFGFGELNRTLPDRWKGQRLTNGLPLITTTFEENSVRFEVEQFAFPLHGPPSERRGDIPMVLLQKLRLTDLSPPAEPRDRTVTVSLTHERRLPESELLSLSSIPQPPAWVWRVRSGSVLLTAEGAGMRLRTNVVDGTQSITNRITLEIDLPAGGTRDIVLKLPSPLVPPEHASTLLALDYDLSRNETVRFWSGHLARGAQFTVPEETVNDLFRANLWHALRLPRRHGGAGARIDLPYSNFAYDQNGTPWPVNQAIYVDYMLYDLRGYHAEAAEELRVMFQNNQRADGRVAGFANWGVYTPSMIYAAAQHVLLSGDKSSFERLLPRTLDALDWCLGEIRRSATKAPAAAGLVLAPLNDLSHDSRGWAFNQAYFYGAFDLLGRALAQINHRRAAECARAAAEMRSALERAFGAASAQAPIVPLRDGTWIPYVPGDATQPRRLFEIWYPTDVDTGPLHLPRLRALPPESALATFLLHDHEDNLFFREWGMANEPVYNQQATVYLDRDEPKAAIRAFYSMLACAFSHSVYEPVEHRWGWGQYFGPPSTDGAWFELYRNMLLRETGPDSLWLLQATPRAWLEDGKRIDVRNAPTYFGPMSFSATSQSRAGQITVALDMPARRPPERVVIRLRHPAAARLVRVQVNGANWSEFDPAAETISIPRPILARYDIVANYRE